MQSSKHFNYLLKQLRGLGGNNKSQPQITQKRPKTPLLRSSERPLQQVKHIVRQRISAKKR